MLFAVAFATARRRTRKINECNSVLGNESSGSVASAICSTEKILWRGGKGMRLRVEKRVTPSRQREGESVLPRHYASPSYRPASNVCSFSCLLQFRALLGSGVSGLCVINHHK